MALPFLILNYNTEHRMIDGFLMGAPSFSKDDAQLKAAKYREKVTNLYSSHYVPDCITALKHLQSVDFPPRTYKLISCHISYVTGTAFTGSYRMLLQIPLLLSSIGVALKHLELSGDLVIFMTVINVHVPSVRKLIQLLTSVFAECTFATDPINQNFFLQFPDYYLQCRNYKGCTPSVINQLIEFGITYSDNYYHICDMMNYFTTYALKHPQQSLFYRINPETAKLVYPNQRGGGNTQRRSAASTPTSPTAPTSHNNIKTLLFNTKNNSTVPTKKARTSATSTKAAADVPIVKYLADFTLRGFKFADTKHSEALATIMEQAYIATFTSLNQLMTTALLSTGEINPLVAAQIKQTNIARYVHLLEYNKVAYNKHILQVMKQETDNLISRFYDIDNTIHTVLIKYRDAESLRILHRNYAEFVLSAPASNTNLDAQCARINTAYTVKQELLRLIGVDRAPLIVRAAYEDFARGLKNYVNMRYEGSLPTRKGVSNAFLKLWEILHVMPQLMSSMISKGQQQLRVFHICEAPGQMILSVQHLVRTLQQQGKFNMRNYDWRANSLNPTNSTNIKLHGTATIFGDEYKLMERYPEKWLWGADNTGDITNTANISWFRQYIQQWCGNSGLQLIIGDGGLSTGLPPLMLQKLDLAQVLMVLSCTGYGGNCVIKHFTPYIKRHNETNTAAGFFFGFLYLYYLAFDTVSFYKPYTSNPDSGEFYVIGCGFKNNITTTELQRLYDILNKFKLNECIIKMDEMPAAFIMQIIAFVEKMTDMNVTSEEKQNMLLTCYKFQHEAQYNKYLNCSSFMTEGKLREIQIPRFQYWIKHFKFRTITSARNSKRKR
jgi:hypothetical protein